MTASLNPQRALFGALIVLLGCDGDLPIAAPPDASSRDAGPIPRPARCGASDQAPLRDTDGRTTCTAVGARFVARAGEWPATDDAGTLPMPVRYVRAGADVSVADGTRERPFATLPAALQSLSAGGGTVMVARGRHVITAPLEVRGSVVIAGVGPSATEGTVFEGGGATVFVATGATTRLTLRGLFLEHSAAPSDASAPVASVRVEGGAAVRAENVAIVQAGIGVRVLGRSTFFAEGLTVLRAVGQGVLVTEGSRCDLRDVLIRDGLGRGVEVRESHLQLHRAFVHENADIGVALASGAHPDPTGGAARCSVEGPSSEPGPLNCLSLASITCNGIAAVFTQGQVSSQGLRLVLSGTRRVGSLPGGDGLTVLGGASFDLDPGVNVRGAGSEIVGNARVGVLVQNAGSSFSMHGALVGANEATGLFIANLATVSQVAASEFSHNVGVGVAVATSTELMDFRGNLVHDTQTGVVPGGTTMVGDGISAGNAAVGMVVGNTLSGNPRFAGIFSGARGTLSQNDGMDNGFRLYAYDSPGLTIDSTNRVQGRAEGAGRPAVTTEVPR